MTTTGNFEWFWNLVPGGWPHAADPAPPRGVVDLTRHVIPEPKKSPWVVEQIKTVMWAKDLQRNAASRVTRAEEITRLIPRRIEAYSAKYKAAVNRLFEIAPARNRDDMSKFLRVIRKNMGEEHKYLSEVLDRYLDSALRGEVTAQLDDVKCAFDNWAATQRSTDVVMGQALQVAKYEEVDWVALTRWIKTHLPPPRPEGGLPGTGGRIPNVTRAVTNAIVYGQYWDSDGSLLDDTLAPLHLDWEEGNPIYHIMDMMRSEGGIRLGQLAHRLSTICTRNPTAKDVVSGARAAWFPELDRPDGHLATDMYKKNQWFADLNRQVKSGDTDGGFANVRYYMGSDAPLDPQAALFAPIYPARVSDAGLPPQQLLREFVHQVRYDAGLVGRVQLIRSAGPDHLPEYNWKELYVQPGFMAMAWSLEWWSATNPTVDSFDYVSSDIDALNRGRATPHVFAEETTTAKDWFKAHMKVITAKDGADIQSVVRQIAILKQTLIDMQTRMRAEEEMPVLGPALRMSQRAAAAA